MELSKWKPGECVLDIDDEGIKNMMMIHGEGVIKAMAMRAVVISDFAILLALGLSSEACQG